MLTRADLLESLARDAGSFIALIRMHGADTPVPDCPGWTLAHLGRHVGVVHRWATEIVRTGQVAERPTAPDDPADLGPWLADGVEELLATLRAVDPERETWTFGPPPRRAGFWIRRQAHETSMHLHDARHAISDPHPMDVELAADGVDEMLTVFIGRQVRSGALAPIPVGIRFVLTDADAGPWVLVGDGIDNQIAAVATVTGRAEDVLLALWRRTPVRGVDVAGDASAVADLFGRALTP